MSAEETMKYLFFLRALDVLIDKKYDIQENYDRGDISYEEYEHYSFVIQDRIDYISPVDISFI